MPKITTLTLTNIVDKKQLPAKGDMVNTNDFDWVPFSIVSVKILTNFKKYPGMNIYTAWVDFDGKLEHLLIDFDEEMETRHGIGGNWQDEHNYYAVKSLAARYKLEMSW